MLFHAAVERGAGEAELRGGERDVVAVLLQRFLDHLLLDPLEVEIVARRRRRGGRGDRRGARRREPAGGGEVGPGEGGAVGQGGGAATSSGKARTGLPYFLA